MNRYTLALDLKEDPQLIEEYEEYHRNVWPEILKSIRDTGIIDMEIYRVGNRLFMIMETDASFSFEKKEEVDKMNSKVKEWEEVMWKYQQAIPAAKPGEKWVLMKKIFSLHEQLPE